MFGEDYVKKDIPLEGIRGLAAIAVMLGHIIGSFTLYSPNILSTPFGFLINGHGAVVLFFVLSGYVLTRRYFLTEDSTIILRGVLKRWPRLMGPVLAAVLVSWFMYYIGAYHYEEAAALSGISFPFPPYPFEPSLLKAVAEGAVLTFIRDNYCSYDSVLWTMHFEFVGSLLSFGFALMMVALRARPFPVTVIVSVVAVILCHFANPNYVAFICGVMLARWLTNAYAISPKMALLTLIVALLFLGYTPQAGGIYRIFNASSHSTYTYIQLTGALLAIGIIQACRKMHQLIDNRFMEFLGELSFPLYLVHILVIGSIGAQVFVLTRSPIAAVFTSVFVSLICALPFLWFNQKWVKGVNTLIEGLLNGMDSRASAGRSTGEKVGVGAGLTVPEKAGDGAQRDGAASP